MDCNVAQELIDQRVHDLGLPADGEPRDWYQLDVHVSQCSRCAADWVELQRTRRAIAAAGDEAPSAQDVEKMWNAVRAGVPLAEPGRSPGAWRSGLWRFGATGIAAAATLAGAFAIGRFHYGRPTFLDLTLGNDAVAVSSAARFGSAGDRIGDLSMPAPSDDATGRPESNTTRAFWMAVRNGDTTVKQFICPSASQVVDDTAEIDRYYDFKNWSKASFGYGVPFGPTDTRILYQSSEKTSTPGMVMAGTGPMHATDAAIPPLPAPSAAVVSEANRDGRPKIVFGLPHVEGRYTGRDDYPPYLWGVDFSQGAAPSVTTGAGADGFSLNTDDLTRGSGDDQFSAPLIVNPAPSADSGKSEGERDGVDDMLLVARTANPSNVRANGEAYLIYGHNSLRFGGDVDASAAGKAMDGATAGAPSGVAQSQPSAAALSARPEPAGQLKVIKTGELAIEVASYRDSAEAVEGIIARFGATLADGATQEQAGRALAGRFVIRVGPEQFEALFAALKAVGRVESENVKAADVTAEYVDLEARIRSSQVAEERLQELVKNKSIVDKVSSLLEVERELTRVRGEIEKMQGQLRVMADRVALSTIALTLHEPARTVPSASLSVEVSTLDEAGQTLGEVIGKLGGRLASGKTSKRPDGTLQGDYALSVSLAHFGELLSAIESLGRVNERQVKDRQFGDAAAAWAEKVQCQIALVLFERSRQLPAGSVRIEVDALDPVIKKLDAILSAQNASITSNQTRRQDDGSNVADLKVRVPAGEFAALIDALAPLGRTIARQVAGEAGRIVGGAANMPSELSLTLAERPREVPSGVIVIEVGKFDAARRQLSALIGAKGVHVMNSASNQRTDGTWVANFRLGIKSRDMEPVVAGLEVLGRVVSRQISGLGLGDLSRTDPNAVGVIDLALGEKSTISPEPDRAGASLRSKLRDGLAGLYSSLGLIVYGLVMLAPWMTLVLVAAWLITRSRRKAKALRKPQPAAT